MIPGDELRGEGFEGVRSVGRLITVPLSEVLMLSMAGWPDEVIQTDCMAVSRPGGLGAAAGR